MSWGEEIPADPAEYSIENWQMEQGLPQISVTAIAQRSDGYLWVGTFNGLARFDGVRFKIFDEGNTPALGSSRITGLTVDDQDGLWILTEPGGLVRMAAGQFTAFLREDASLARGGACFLRDTTHHLLLLDGEGGLRRIENGRLLAPDRLDRSRGGDEPVLLVENSGGAAVTHRGKVIRAHDGAQSVRPTLSVRDSEGNKSDRIELAIDSAAPSQSGGYWLATDTGIYLLREGQLSARLAPLPPGVTRLLHMQEDGHGTLWASRWGQGPYRWDRRGSWQRFGAGKGLSDSYVNRLFRDREGSLWVGTSQGGLHRLRPRAVRMHDTGGGAGGNVVMSVTQDRRGRMWFGVNGGGLHEWVDGRLEPARGPDLLRSYPLVYSVLADREDAVWVGIYGRVALRWHGDTVTHHDLGDESSRTMTPRALFEDRAGTMWLGCDHGLLRYQGGDFRRYTCREGLSCDRVTALAEDRAGTLYIGTDGGGLNCLRHDRITALTEREGLADNHISALCVDRQDTLWIGTVNGGLSRFKNARFGNFTLQDGLPSNTIGPMLEDDAGDLWLGSNRGLIRVSLQALNQYADGDRRPVDWRVFGLSDGLSTVGCRGTSQPASWKAQDGKLWFATIKGVAVVDLKQLPVNPLPPPVVIEEVVMDDRVRDLQSSDTKAEGLKVAELGVAAAANPRPANGASGSGDAAHASPLSGRVRTVTVPPRTHRLDVHFTGLSLAAPEKVQFRFRLDPFDRDWSQAGTRRVAYYTGIPPGRYQFRVIACNNDGVWNQDGATLGLVVLPPWWMTWWFRALTGISVAGLVFGWYERRLHRLRRERAARMAFAQRLIESQEEERKRIAGEMHDGLGQDLLVIKNRAMLGLKDGTASARAGEQLEEISRMASHTLEEVREISRNLRPYQIDRLGLTKALESMVVAVSRSSGLPCAGEFDSIDGLLASHLEIHLYRIVQELLNNVVKHSDASQCRVSARCEKDRLVLIVEDDGRGFDRVAAFGRGPGSLGLGLDGITERVGMLGGSWQCDSRPGHGTRWRIEIPLRHEA